MNSTIQRITLKTVIILQFVVALSALLSPVRAAEGVEILSHTGYIDTMGNYRVVGEVKNVGNQPVNFVQVTANFYDSNNDLITSRFDLTTLDVILEGRKSPFELALLDVTESALVSSYSLFVSYLESTSLPKNLEILSHSNYTDAEGNMHITGTLRNNGDKKLVNPKVVATYYDDSSVVIATSLTSFDPEGSDEINPNQIVPFEMILEEERTQYVDTYELTAESNEYALIPEFQHGIIPLFIAISLIAIAMANRINNMHKHRSFGLRF